MILNTSNCYLMFRNSSGENHLQSISDMMEVGPLIESEGENEGNEMTLVDETFYDKEGNVMDMIKTPDYTPSLN